MWAEFLSAYRFEDATGNTGYEKFSLPDIEIPAMDRQLFPFNLFLNPRKRHQVMQGNIDICLFTGPALILEGCLRPFFQYPIAGRGNNIHPRIDETIAVILMFTLHKAPDAAALTMPEDNDLSDTQDLDRKLDGCTCPVRFAILFMRWYDIGNITYNEDLAGIGVQDLHRVDA